MKNNKKNVKKCIIKIIKILLQYYFCRMRGASNREKLKEFYKSKAREEAELVRNPEINLNSSQFNKDAYVSKILRNLPLASLLGFSLLRVLFV